MIFKERVKQANEIRERIEDAAEDLADMERTPQ